MSSPNPQTLQCELFAVCQFTSSVCWTLEGANQNMLNFFLVIILLMNSCEISLQMTATVCLGLKVTFTIGGAEHIGHIPKNVCLLLNLTIKAKKKQKKQLISSIS